MEELSSVKKIVRIEIITTYRMEIEIPDDVKDKDQWVLDAISCGDIIIDEGSRLENHAEILEIEDLAEE